MEKQSIDIIEDDNKLTPTEAIEGQQEVTEKAPKKTAAKKPAAKKPAAKEETPKKTAAKKPAVKKAADKKDEPKGNWWSKFFK